MLPAAFEFWYQWKLPTGTQEPTAAPPSVHPPRSLTFTWTAVHHPTCAQVAPLLSCLSLGSRGLLGGSSYSREAPSVLHRRCHPRPLRQVTSLSDDVIPRKYFLG